MPCSCHGESVGKRWVSASLNSFDMTPTKTPMLDSKESATTPADGVKRVITAVQEQSLLWVHGRCLGEGDAVCSTVEQIDLRQEGTVANV